MTENIPRPTNTGVSHEEMLAKLRDRASNYKGQNHGADPVCAWALAEIERLRMGLSAIKVGPPGHLPNDEVAAWASSIAGDYLA